MVSREAIAAIVGHAEVASAEPHDEAPASPGLLGRHYAPRARVRLFTSANRDATVAEARAALNERLKVGAMFFSTLPLEVTQEYRMPTDVNAYARELYATLHALDEAGCDLVLIERPPEAEEWAAVLDRLDRMMK